MVKGLGAVQTTTTGRDADGDVTPTTTGRDADVGSALIYPAGSRAGKGRAGPAPARSGTRDFYHPRGHSNYEFND